MIALCDPHHKFADRGHYSLDELRHLKASAGNLPPARGLLPWGKSRLLLEAGTNWWAGDGCWLDAGGHRPFEIAWDDELNAWALSLQLVDDDGPVLTVDRNWICVDRPEVYDCEIRASQDSIKIWFAPRRVGLDMTFERVPQSSVPRCYHYLADPDGRLAVVSVKQFRTVVDGSELRVSKDGLCVEGLMDFQGNCADFTGRPGGMTIVRRDP